MRCSRPRNLVIFLVTSRVFPPSPSLHSLRPMISFRGGLSLMLFPPLIPSPFVPREQALTALVPRAAASGRNGAEFMRLLTAVLEGMGPDASPQITGRPWSIRDRGRTRWR